MVFKYLEWDSEFFNKAVYSLSCDNTEELNDVVAILQTQSFDLCYVFLPKSSDEVQEKLKACNGALYDKKTTFCKEMSSPCGDASKNAPNLQIRKLTQSSDDAEYLAIQSGWCSRFKRDPKLSSFQPELYRLWFQKDLYSNQSSVFACYCQDKIIGIACASLGEEDKGILDLIAVDASCRHLGIGCYLLHNVEQYWHQHNRLWGKITTQMDNIPACSFYKRNGYSIDSIQEVWHVWKEH